SGKTSLTELFRRLLSEKSPSFRLEDFSCGVHQSFFDAYALQYANEDAEKVRACLPAIEVTLEVDYAKDAGSFGTLSHFIVDLDPACTRAVIIIRYELADGKLDALFESQALDPAKATPAKRA